jgi:hypothetical protein
MTSPDRTRDPAASAQDDAEITGVAAAHVGYDLLLVSGLNRGGGQL